MRNRWNAVPQYRKGHLLLQLKCHDPNGEVCFAALSCSKVRISSYADDAIRATVWEWADGKPELS
ncbi:hypothetical protein [Methanogenium organophilum]|uniref:Uncharacterized protein n=1 Tax=Methanogenium organophilum TaxID=2199 RepID=A0A9X9S3U0_METOG|nr:hypothetical protein [Methanogenium organophilum]WAI01414.1 hypothetical protein OU421_00640 [Methanogenium organophilum]